MALTQSLTRSISVSWRRRRRRSPKDESSCDDVTANLDSPKSVDSPKDKPPRSKHRLSLFSRKRRASGSKAVVQAQTDSNIATPAIVRTTGSESNVDSMSLPEPPQLKLGQSSSISSNLTLCNDLDSILGLWGLPKDSQELDIEKLSKTGSLHQSGSSEIVEQQSLRSSQSLETVRSSGAAPNLEAVQKLLVLVNTALILRRCDYRSLRDSRKTRTMVVTRKQSLAELVQKAKAPVSAFDTHLTLCP